MQLFETEGFIFIRFSTQLSRSVFWPWQNRNMICGLPHYPHYPSGGRTPVANPSPDPSRGAVRRISSKVCVCVCVKPTDSVTFWALDYFGVTHHTIPDGESGQKNKSSHRCVFTWPASSVFQHRCEKRIIPRWITHLGITMILSTWIHLCHIHPPPLCCFLNTGYTSTCVC
jgi:hypothetical protein